VAVVISLNRFLAPVDDIFLAPVDDTVTAHSKTQVTSHIGWSATIGRVLLATEHTREGSVRVRGHVTGRVSQCLPAVLSRACVDTWASASSCGSFSTQQQSKTSDGHQSNSFVIIIIKG
jgi:hypothetical protein